MCARKILLVDDDSEFRSSVRNTLGGAYVITDAASEAEFRVEFRPYTFDLVILDMRLESEREGLQLLREILAYDELQPVIMVSAYGDTDAVLDSAESGALMFLHKQEFTPALLGRMVEAVLQQGRVRRRLAALESRVPWRDTIGLTGKNPAARRALEMLQRAADDPESTVLVIGEQGTGQELAAQVIHDRSRTRSSAPLVFASGRSSYSEDLRTALFGRSSQRGTPHSKGWLEQANGGVLFLDQIELVTVGIRNSLTKALRKRTLNLNELPVPLDLQLVAGTGIDGAVSVITELRKASVGSHLVEIYLQPLRERREDISLLATFFLQELRQIGRTSARTLSRDSFAALEAHTWPGNLPELRNAVEFGAIKAMVEHSEEVGREHLPANLLKGSDSDGLCGGRWDFRYQISRAELALVQRALNESGAANKKQLAEMLGYSDRFAFGRRIRKALGEFPDLGRDFPKVNAKFKT